MDYRNNIFTFGTREHAFKFVSQVCRILLDYKQVTLSDLYELVEDDSCDYLTDKVVWLPETIIPTAQTIDPKYDTYKDWWYVKFPEPDQYPASDKVSYKHCECHTTWCNTYKAKKTPTPEPLNITINIQPFNEVDYTTIREVIQQANEIKDRPVFITIN